MNNSLGQQAKTNGLEYCSKCKAWKLYESDGKCRACGKQIVARESTADMIADYTERGYITS